MNNILEIENVTKLYGTAAVLQDINLEIRRGSIHGLVGRNGSGKTMLLKCICGLVPVTSGEIRWEGKVIGKDVEKPDRMGALIEGPGFLEDYNAMWNLRFLRELQGKADPEVLKQAIRTVGLNPDDRKKVGKYSMGMKQRLGIAQAIMEDPDVIILDEPMNGLDNAGVREMRELFKSLRAQGKTIIMASHNREDIDELCDNVYEMDAGILTKVR